MTKREKKIASILILLVMLFLTLYLAIATEANVTYEETILEQETKIEQLQERNATLQQERDEAYEDYAILRDQLWNLNNSLERECNQ